MTLCKTLKIKQSSRSRILILLSVTLLILFSTGNIFAGKKDVDLNINLQFYVPGAIDNNSPNQLENINNIVSDLNKYYLLRGVIFDFEINKIDNSILTENEFSTYLNNKKPGQATDASYDIFVAGQNSSDAKLIKSDYIVMNFGSDFLNERSILTGKLSQNLALWYTLKNTLKFNLLSGDIGSNTTYDSKAIADINNDGAGPNISDLAYMINKIVGSKSEDSDQDDFYDISDVIELVDYLFNK